MIDGREQREWRAHAGANLYSLIQIARTNSLESFTYLRHVAAQLPRSDKPEHLEVLLPHRVASGSPRNHVHPR